VRVSHRLLLTLLPAFIGLMTVVALAYWGQYARQAPHVAVVAAAVALAGSVVLALRNARYLAQRIERLASAAGPGPRDELESIERSVETLHAEIAAAREQGARQERILHEQRADLNALLATAARAATQAVDEVRLPLHILLENRFGDLNENQEEMLGAAQASAEDAWALLRRLQLVAELERGSIELRADSVRIDDIVRGLLPTLQAFGAKRGVRVEAELPPGLPRVRADRTHLQEALAILLRSAVEMTGDGGEVRVNLQPQQQSVRLVVDHGPGAADSLDQALLQRLVQAMAAGISRVDNQTVVELPLAGRSASV
jgi:signal transduction histidine kinase